MGVRFEFDVSQLPSVKHGVAEERALLQRAQSGDEFAAADLLLRYEDGALQDIVVKNWITLGQAAVARKVATDALRAKEKGKTAKVAPMSFFKDVEAAGRRGNKGNADARLALLAGAGKLLTATELAQALSGKPNPLKVHRLEALLAKHVQHMHKGASDAAAVAYVRTSLPNIPWGNEDARDADVSYGPD